MDIEEASDAFEHRCKQLGKLIEKNNLRESENFFKDIITYSYSLPLITKAITKRFDDEFKKVFTELSDNDFLSVKAFDLLATFKTTLIMAARSLPDLRGDTKKTNAITAMNQAADLNEVAKQVIDYLIEIEKIYPGLIFENETINFYASEKFGVEFIHYDFNGEFGVSHFCSSLDPFNNNPALREWFNQKLMQRLANELVSVHDKTNNFETGNADVSFLNAGPI